MSNGQKRYIHQTKGGIQVPKKSNHKSKPAVDPEAREKQLINKAMALAEKQLEAGTASPSVITHFLKMGASNMDTETEILRSQAALYKAKAEALQTEAEAKDLAESAIEAMRNYKSPNGM